ncbi:MAG: nitrate- and nitrite sensing domain-containing protein [Emcibacter sp.]|nr:nitrate- and nitrite sensing domain-containing protein [Emcibacter sp.]
MLKSLTIKNRLFLLITIFLVGTLLIGGSYIYKGYNEYRQNAILKENISYLPILSHSIHTLQAERGAVTGYLLSENKACFDKILKEKILETDQNIAALVKIKDHLYINSDFKNINHFTTQNIAAEQIEILNQIRLAVTISQTDAMTALQTYSGIIDRYINIIDDLNWWATTPQISRSLISYKYFLLWKENTGIERALGSGGFDQNFSEIQHHIFLLQIAKVNTFRDLFMGTSSTNHSQAIQDMQNSSENIRIKEIKQFITASKLNELKNAISGVEWYNLLSTKINIMNDIEKLLIADIIKQTQDNNTEKKNQIIIVSVISLFLLLFSVMVSLKIALSISRPLRDIETIMRELSHENKKISAMIDNIPYMNEPNEIGYLSKNFNQMLITLYRQKESLRKARKNAEAADVAKGNFIANMSHELRTPLNAIIGFSEVLALNKEKKVEENIEYIDYIQDSGRHLLDLVNEILNMSQIETKVFSLKEKTFSLRKILEHSIAYTTKKYDAKEISLINRFPEADLWFRADKKKIEQVFMHLLSNAFKFTPKKGKITLDTSFSVHSGLIISFKDTGIGMNEKEIKESFKIFNQKETGYARTHDGIGLGLPIANSLVEQHGGKIEIESTLGSGTTVTLYFPVERVSMDINING